MLWMMIGAVALIIVLGVFAHFRERKRVQALQRGAEELGLSFSARKRGDVPLRYGFFELFKKGSNRYASNCMSGVREGKRLELFDYHYETYSTDSEGRRKTHHHHMGCVLLALPRDCPELIVRPEGFFDKVAAVAGFDDIDFESYEFSRKFHVKSSDKKFAYGILHPRMMEHLLRYPGFSLEFEDRYCLVWKKGKLKAETMRHWLDIMAGVSRLLPGYLFEPEADVSGG